MERFTRISRDVTIMGGKACIKGTRVTVGMILVQIGEGISVDEILEEYPYLTKEDIMQAIKYGAWAVDAKTVVRQHRIPFELNVDPFYNDFNQARLRNAVANRDKDTITKTMEELEAMAGDE
jgi:uncharacterized protein (DUF433 family)